MGGFDRGPGEGDARALTPIVAVAVLVGLVITSAVAVFLVGSGALFAMQDDTDVEQAATAMEQLSHDVHSGAPAAASLPDGGTAYVDSSAGNLTVTIRDQDNGTVVNDPEPVSLGTLYYTNGDTTLAYQGGGVWRTDGGPNGSVVSAPPLQYRNTSDPTLNFPVVTIQGPDGPYDGRQLGTNASAERQFAAQLGDQQRLVNRSVAFEIESEFYLAWADYLEDQFHPSDVTRHHGESAVEVNLTGATRDPGARRTYNVTNGYSNVTGITGFLMNDGPELHPRQGLTIDSYNSDRGPYDGTPGDNGSIISEGDVNLANAAKINGDVVASGGAMFSNDVVVTGSTLVGAETGTTLADSSGGMTFHGVFSSKQDVEVSGGVEFGDHVIVGGDLAHFNGDVNGSLFVHGDVVNESGASYEGHVTGDVVLVGNDDIEQDDLDIAIDGDLVTGASASGVPSPLDVNVSAMDRNIDLGDMRTEFESSNDNCEAYDLRYDTGDSDDPCHESYDDPDDDDWDDDWDDSPYDDPYHGPYGGWYDDPHDATSDTTHDGPAELDCSGYHSDDTCFLSAGDYYVEPIVLSEHEPYEKLILDTSRGPINLFVEGDSYGAVNIESEGSIEVRADGDQHPVTVYSDGDFRVEQGGSVTVPGHRTPLFKVYMDPASKWRISSSPNSPPSTFMGAVFGLSDGSSRTSIGLSGGSGSAVYGAMLGDIIEFDQRGAVHYDEALAEVREPDTDVEYEEGTSGGRRGSVDASSADVEYLNVGYTVLQGE